MTKQDNKAAKAKKDTGKEGEMELKAEVCKTSCCSSSPWLILLLLSIFLAAGYFALQTKPEWFNLPTTKQASTPNKQVLQLEKKIGTLTTQLEAMEQRLQKLEVESQTVEKATSPTEEALEQLKNNIATLFDTSKRIGLKLQEAIRGYDFSGIMIYLQLKDKVLQGMAYNNELIALEQSLSDRPDLYPFIESLKQHAEEGVKTPMALYKEWKEKIVEVENLIKQKQAQTWQDRLSSAIDSLVSVKPIGVKEGQVTETKQISQSLQAGKIEEALLSIQKLPEDMQKHLTAWTTEAKAHESVMKSLQQLSKAMIAQPVLKEPLTPTSELDDSAPPLPIESKAE